MSQKTFNSGLCIAGLFLAKHHPGGATIFEQNAFCVDRAKIEPDTFHL
ncbi:MAG: hypothetical protein ACD_39C00793G0001 [uncultured bacterium]|nr:MAG: hypothetical protein ACD_39C00793G0001 [uncultured bacterium]